ncbi:T9SS type A sorting domain-containing protein [Polaribacter aestuariivivens]|uniref:T9SS type A sorting domain-containing protein n=1 Tax=Polaribacter aestuariivivens TaxID=2304626 RepID=UPI003F4950AE
MEKKYFLILFLLSNPIFIFSQNDTEKSIKIWRTSSNTEALITFPVSSFTIPQNTTMYIHVMVNYAVQPDIALRVDAADTDSNGTSGTYIRPINRYTNYGEWQNLVFPVSGGQNGQQVNTIIIFPDLGIENEPSGQVLNNSNSFGYIDEIILSSNTTLSNENIFGENNKFLLYPNPTRNTFKFSTEKNIIEISLFNSLGKEVTQNMVKISEKEYDISNLSSGLYFIKFVDENGLKKTKKLLKQ